MSQPGLIPHGANPHLPVSPEIIEETWQRMAEMEPEDGAGLVHRMQDEQPDLLAYLLSADEEMFDDDERGVILYVGVALWQMMRQSRYGLAVVTGQNLEGVLVESDRSLEMYEEDTEADLFSAAQALLENYPEPYALGYLLEALMEEHEDPGIRDDSKGLAFLHLKIALDAMIASLGDDDGEPD